MRIVNRIIDTGEEYKGYIFETVKDFETLLKIANGDNELYIPKNNNKN